MNEATERIFISQDWITITLMIVFTLLLLNRIKYGDRFYKLQYILLNNTYINSYAKASPTIFNIFNIIFYVVATIIISFLIFIAHNLYKPNQASYDFIFFLKIVFYVSIFIVVRIIIGVLLGVLFEKEKDQHYFSFLKISYLGNFSLIILPFLVINFYFKSDVFSYFLLIASLVLFLYYYILIIKNNQTLVFGRSFYFILYLCTLEIAPFAIILNILIT